MKKLLTEKERRGRIVRAVVLIELFAAFLLCVFVDPTALSAWERIGLTALFLVIWALSVFFFWRWYEKAPKSSEN